MKTMVVMACTLILLGGAACQQSSEYEQWVKEALNSGVQNDSLFLGYSFGMTRDDFFDHSWAINKQGLVLNGSGAEIVEDLQTLKAPAKRVFYPSFNNEQIAAMPVTYSYKGWAPWNRHLFSDSLLIDLKKVLEQEYGGQFVMFPDTAESKSYIQISGNREIRIFEESESEVIVIFKDLSNQTVEN